MGAGSRRRPLVALATRAGDCLHGPSDMADRTAVLCCAVLCVQFVCWFGSQRPTNASQCNAPRSRKEDAFFIVLAVEKSKRSAEPRWWTETRCLGNVTMRDAVVV